MSDEEEIGFDDWEAEADVAIEESKVEEPAKEQPQEEEVRPDVEEEKKEKVKVVDPHEALLSKIAHYKQLNDNTFDGLLEESRKNSSSGIVKPSVQILKNEKDFTQFGKTVGRRFNEHAEQHDLDNLNEDDLLGFMEETILLLYSQFEWKNMEGVKSKLTIVKRDKKDEEVREAKKKKKEEMLRRAGGTVKAEGESEKKVETGEDDLFGGPTMNSKQEEEERKKKEPAREPVPVMQDEDDDDDFM